MAAISQQTFAGGPRHRRPSLCSAALGSWMQELEAEVKAILLTVQHAPDFQLHHGVAASGPRLQAARCSWQLYSELLEAVLAVAQPELRSMMPGNGLGPPKGCGYELRARKRLTCALAHILSEKRYCEQL